MIHDPTPLPGAPAVYELTADEPPASGTFAPEHVELSDDEALAGETLGQSIEQSDDSDNGL